MTITVTGGPAYGLSWDKTADTYARVASATGLTAGASFNGIAPWSQMRRCNLWDNGVATAWYGDRCYTDTDVANMGQCMVHIPKFYYYMEYDTGTTTYYWFITTDSSATIDVGLGVGAQAVKVHPAFSRDSVIKDRIFIGAYASYYNTSTTAAESKAGIAPKVSATMPDARIYARTRVSGGLNKWEVQDYLSTCAIQLLYLLEYGGFDSQTLLGGGLTSAAGLQLTGLTAAYGNASYGVTADRTHAMSYRGIENVYGNYRILIDGINIKANDNPWVADHDFSTNLGAFAHPYIDTGLTLSGVDGAYTTDIATNATYDYGFLPSAATGGSATTKLSDWCNRSVGNQSIVYNGGTYNDGTYVGMFYIAYITSPNYAFTTFRLMYIG